MGKISLSSGAVGAKGQAASRMHCHPQAVSKRGSMSPPSSLHCYLVLKTAALLRKDERPSVMGQASHSSPQEVAAGGQQFKAGFSYVMNLKPARAHKILCQ